ncbi:fungal-specific transcription factor domain-containing protein [Gautieria morchelliformis]|nr:fungal-specific transcription factor domain-containing protein [Gautieria morchelliformis]
MASNARGEDQAHCSSTDDEGPSTHKAKRRKGPKACDVCRRKKIRCDPDPSGDPHQPCVNCAVFKTECAFTYVAKKRRTQQAFIDGLQTRLTKLEHILHTIAPGIDLDKELDETTSSILSRPRPRAPSPLRAVMRPPHDHIKPSEVVAAFTDWRDSSNDPEDESEDDLPFFIPDSQDDDKGRESSLPPHRFHGNSSGISFVRKVIGMKRETTDDTPAQCDPHFISVPEPVRRAPGLLPNSYSFLQWERRTNRMPPPKFHFPPASLMSPLISIFFRCVQPFFPLVHQPTFEAAVMEGRHEGEAPFGAVVMLVCAVASRWSDDRRVLPRESLEEGRADEQSWVSAGWDFYAQVHQRYRKNILQPTTVYDLQLMALGCIYLQGTSNSSAAWQMAGLGLRLALEAGAHSRKRPGSGDLLETEMWKRTFWSLVVLDRLGSSGLGRPCAIWEEDIDLDLPLEVDDEYLTPEAGYCQPPDKPPRMAYFNYYVKLSQILIGALRTIYGVNRAKSVFHIGGPQWEQDMVAALDSSLNSWIDGIPEHLRWDANRNTDDITFYQSALINCSYNYVQIVVHRPYITPSRSRKLSTGTFGLAFPSLAICTNAARSCSHVLEACTLRWTMYIPQMNNNAFTAAVVLLFNVWGMNKPGMAVKVDWEKEIRDVHICMRFIKQTIGRWKHAGKLWSMLHELVSVGALPLPRASPPSNPGTAHQGQGQKRSREAEDPSVFGTRTEIAAPSPNTSGTEGRSPSSSMYTPSITDEHLLGSVHNPELPTVTVKPDPLVFDQMQLQLQSDANLYFGSGEPPSKLPDAQPPQPPIREFQYEPEVALRNLSFDQRRNTTLVPQNPAQGHEQVPQADDVLMALEAVYRGGSSALAHTPPTDIAHQTFDVWGGGYPQYVSSFVGHRLLD